MQMKQTWILLFARPYRMLDEKTGVVNEGVSINYYPSDNFNPVFDDEKKGFKPCKGSLPIEVSSKITHVPGFYNFSVEMSADSAGKPTLKVKDLEFVSALPIAEPTKPQSSPSGSKAAV